MPLRPEVVKLILKQQPTIKHDETRSQTYQIRNETREKAATIDGHRLTTEPTTIRSIYPFDSDIVPP